MYLRNVSIDLQIYTAPKPRTPSIKTLFKALATCVVLCIQRNPSNISMHPYLHVSMTHALSCNQLTKY
jgi:hypothetical protein